MTSLTARVRPLLLACGVMTAGIGASPQALADTATGAVRAVAAARARPDPASAASLPTDAHSPVHPPAPPPVSAPAVILQGAFRLDAKHAPTSNAGHFTAAGTNVSALYLSRGATLHARNPTITSDSQTSSDDNSRFQGQNAALLATSRSHVTVTAGTIHTTGSGANAAAAADPGTRIALERVDIHTQGAGAYGVDAVKGAAATLQDCTLRTEGIRSAALAINGGGRIQATGGVYGTTGARSPVLYSGGTLTVQGAQMQAHAAEGAVVEGANAVMVDDSVLRGKTHAVRIYRRASGDASTEPGRFTMTGGTLSTDRDALFLVTNTHGLIELDHVRLDVPGGREAVLLEARADRWGTPGQNGGTVRLQAHRQILQGVIRADRLSEADVVLEDGSHLIGRATRASVTLDAGSRWTLTSDAQVLALTEPDGTSPDAIANIDSQGHLLHYDARLPANAWLGGKRHALPGGGALLPDGKVR